MNMKASDILKEGAKLRARKLTKNEVEDFFKRVKESVKDEHLENKKFDKKDWMNLYRPMDI